MVCSQNFGVGNQTPAMVELLKPVKSLEEMEQALNSMKDLLEESIRENITKYYDSDLYQYPYRDRDQLGIDLFDRLSDTVLWSRRAREGSIIPDTDCLHLFAIARLLFGSTNLTAEEMAAIKQTLKPDELDRLLAKLREKGARIESFNKWASISTVSPGI